MKKFKRVLAVLMILFIMLSGCKAKYDESYEYKVLDNGAVCITKYRGDKENIDIPAVIDGMKVIEIMGESNPDWEVIDYLDVFEGNTHVKTVNIPDGVEFIGGGAFSNCKSLTSVKIPGSVTAIGLDAFAYCTGLKTIDIPEGVKSISDDIDMWVSYSEAFAGCTGLTSIDISEGAEKICDCAFSDCTSLTTINIPGSVKEIEDAAFDGCDSLEDIYFGGSEEKWKSIVGDSEVMNNNVGIGYGKNF